MTIAEQPSRFDVNPQISSELFNGHADAAFWVGRVESDDAQNYDALARFRANVYVGEMGFLGPDDVDDEGRELDHDDDRSVHFAAVEKSAESSNTPRLARIVACGRLIVKRSVEDLLPIETTFPEIFSDTAASVGSVEVSRFISRHDFYKDNGLTQHVLALAIIRAMTHYSVNNDIDSDYCIIEAPLLGLLSKIGLPLEVLGDPKDSVEPGGIRKLYPIRISPDKILDSVTKDDHDTIFLRDFFKDEADNAGQGFYPATLTGGQN